MPHRLISNLCTLPLLLSTNLPSAPGTGLIPSPSSGAPACTACMLEMLIALPCGELARVVRVDGVGDEARSEEDVLEKCESVARDARASSSSSRKDGTGEDARERSPVASEGGADAGFMNRWTISGSDACRSPCAKAMMLAAAASSRSPCSPSPSMLGPVPASGSPPSARSAASIASVSAASSVSIL